MHSLRAGFTLVELLVALTLLGVGAAGWVGTSAVAVRIAGSASRGLSALSLAHDHAERAVATSCANDRASAGASIVRVERAWIAEREPRMAVIERLALCARP